MIKIEKQIIEKEISNTYCDICGENISKQFQNFNGVFENKLDICLDCYKNALNIGVQELLNREYPPEVLNLSVRARKILKILFENDLNIDYPYLGIKKPKTMEDLITIIHPKESYSRILLIPNCGKKTYKEICNAIDEYKEEKRKTTNNG